MRRRRLAHHDDALALEALAFGRHQVAAFQNVDSGGQQRWATAGGNEHSRQRTAAQAFDSQRQPERGNGPSFLLRDRSPSEKSGLGEDEAAKDSGGNEGPQGELQCDKLADWSPQRKQGTFTNGSAHRPCLRCGLRSELQYASTRRPCVRGCGRNKKATPPTRSLARWLERRRPDSNRG